MKIKIMGEFITGNLYFSPFIVRFDPVFYFCPQIKNIVIRSTFQKNIIIKKVESLDKRFIPILMNRTLAADSKTEALKILFDPGIGIEKVSFHIY